ncbi:DUF3649 domain-containing protein [Azospirillum isscasi]|uniref:DUF3649 domain-containing protein n=1 Tax=Azospirillum isscasi TaxID=3053926 RepID=A0ABU0WQD7_9PROT|nr:DUF3649 domain-containing protein [Azospirillum isscasi]MDQ2106458.1 DUF3649 domain-containing protein [Azospirillum isscasi]
MTTLPSRMKAGLAGADGRRRLDVASRCLAGIGGGYALAAVAAMFLALALPLALAMPRAEAVYTATMLSFAIHAGAIVWAFSVRARRVWPGLLVPALLLGGGTWLLHGLQQGAPS